MRREIVVASVWALGCAVAFGADAPVAANWQAKLPAIQAVVRHMFPKEAANAHYPASIALTGDLSGKDGSEALVNLGSGGYTDDVTVMQLQGETPVAAKFRGKDDKIGPLVFTSGMAEDRGGEVRFVPKDHAVFSGYWEMKGKKVKSCHGEVYQWDDVGKDFAYAKKLSKGMGKEYCQAVVAKLRK